MAGLSRECPATTRAAQPASTLQNRTATIRSDVAAELAYAAEYRPDAYQTCILIGRPTADGVEVAGFTDLAVVDDPMAFLHELAGDWVPMQRRVTRAGQELEAVGWASFRPQSHGRVDDAEALVHRTFFNLPHQITLVIDPATGEMGAAAVTRGGTLVPVSLPPSDSPSTATPGENP